MKAFLVTLSSFCLCAILLCFLAYETDFFLMSKQHIPVAAIPQQVENSRNEVGTQIPTVKQDLLCSPCVERIAFFMEMIEQEWEEDQDSRLEIAVTPAAQGWAGLSPAQREQAKQLFDQYGTKEGLRRLRASDPDAATQLERERGKPPVPSEADDAPSTR